MGVISVPYTAFSLICLRIADIAEKRSVGSDYTTGVEKSIADLTFVRTIRDRLFKDQYEKKSPVFGLAKKTTSKSFPGYREALYYHVCYVWLNK